MHEECDRSGSDATMVGIEAPFGPVGLAPKGQNDLPSTKWTLPEGVHKRKWSLPDCGGNAICAGKFFPPPLVKHLDSKPTTCIANPLSTTTESFPARSKLIWNAFWVGGIEMSAAIPDFQSELNEPSIVRFTPGKPTRWRGFRFADMILGSLRPVISRSLRPVRQPPARHLTLTPAH